LPQVFYFPLSLDEAPEKRAALHAKCVVVDRHTVFVSSANFTEAAQERNIEVGLLIQAGWLAERITGHFEAMVAERLLLPVYQ
jgi:phosphatidylserine/phosphatidylglycerophosphate/cardiolipin synthase-like enzyme